MPGFNGTFGGLPILVSPLLKHAERKQIRKPKSRRKRIRRKWAKDPRNWTTVLVGPDTILTRDALYVATQELLRRILDSVSGMPPIRPPTGVLGADNLLREIERNSLLFRAESLRKPSWELPIPKHGPFAFEVETPRGPRRK